MIYNEKFVGNSKKIFFYTVCPSTIVAPVTLFLSRHFYPHFVSYVFALIFFWCYINLFLGTEFIVINFVHKRQSLRKMRKRATIIHWIGTLENRTEEEIIDSLKRISSLKINVNVKDLSNYEYFKWARSIIQKSIPKAELREMVHFLKSEGNHQGALVTIINSALSIGVIFSLFSKSNREAVWITWNWLFSGVHIDFSSRGASYMFFYSLLFSLIITMIIVLKAGYSRQKNGIRIRQKLIALLEV